MKKHFGKFGIALVAALLMLLTCALCASAAGTATVVYLRGDGNNEADGLTAANAVASINAAYNLLDPDKDCTVVVCGEFLQKDPFARAHSAKSITITSVYGNVDYRDSGAVYKTAKSARFGLADDTTFKNINFESSDGTSFLLVGQHHAVTIGEGVKMKNFNSKEDAKAFWIVGGCQWGFGGGPTSKTYTTDALKALMQKPTDITVMSGNDMIVVGGPRGNSGAEANRIQGGDIRVTIGGSAQITKLDAAGSGSKYTDVGNINVRVIGGSVKYLYGTRVNNMTAQSLTLLWTDGSIDLFKMMPSGTAAAPVGLSIADGGAVTLKAAAAVRTASNFSAVAEQFNNVECLDHAFGEWTTTTPAGFGTKGEEKRTCAYCDAFETREIPAIKAKLEPGSISAMTDKAGVGTIRMIAKLSTMDGVSVTNYGIFVARTDAIDGAKVAEWTETTGTETAFALDLSEIPQDELGTAIYAWAFVKVDDELITLPIAAGVSVNTIIG